MTTDAEAFFFLHDLITSYLKEKERVLSIQQKALDSFQGHHNEKSKSSQGQDNQDDTKIEGDKLKSLINLLNELDNDEDVQQVFSNFEASEEELAKFA